MNCKKIFSIIVALALAQLCVPTNAGNALRPDSTSTGPVEANADTTARPLTPVERFLDSPAIDPDYTTLLITDLATGKVLASHMPDKGMTPASALKAVTVATLFNQCDMDDVFETPVYREGPVRDGVLEGNIIVKGSGDPTINAGCAPESQNIVTEIVDALKHEGITAVNGRIVVDNTLFTGPSQPESWGSNRNTWYGTGSHAFNFRRNRNGSNSVKDPGAVFTNALRKAMKDAGIEYVGEELEVSSPRRQLLVHRSAPMDEIMRSCMMRSDNLFAECLLRYMASRNGRDGSTRKGADMVKEYWRKKGIMRDNIEIADGSGLSRGNVVSARFLTDVLAKMKDEPYYASFFPLAGEEGTLKRFLKGTPLQAYMALKTGSMNGTQTYAGYKLDDNYEPTHTVVVLINKLPLSREGARKATEKLLLEIFNR